MQGQDGPAKKKEEDVPAGCYPEGHSARPDDHSQGQAGKEDPSQDDKGRGDRDPPGEQPRESEQGHRQMDLKKALLIATLKAHRIARKFIIPISSAFAREMNR